MIGAEGLRLMAGYNRWMNERLYASCATLSDEERKRDRRAFFRSIHGTLNHLLLGDRAWLGRFTGRPVPFRSLDQDLYADFAELRGQRAETDAAIEEFCRELTDERLAAEIDYATQAGKRYRHPLGPAVLHLFNHQTHHRGQITTLLSQLGIDPGGTDVILYYRERSAQT
ncbi:MAG: damage-inducible protein DinB [Deltaproteobacteria bacterium]|nr:damage-inducible protein DinB [Deltaproteobacteria bacterium]